MGGKALHLQSGQFSSTMKTSLFVAAIDGSVIGISVDDTNARLGISVGWTGKVCGVTSPAKICGIPVANIAKVMGIS